MLSPKKTKEKARDKERLFELRNVNIEHKVFDCNNSVGG